MPEPTALLPLAGWESFYVIAGSSAAALTGLNFVVIALGAETQMRMPKTAIRAYTTPTIVHFCIVLLISAILSAPWTALRGASFCLAASAVVGLVYSVVVTWHAARQTDYKPVFEDWMFHSILPIAAYGTLLVIALLLPRYETVALFVVAGVSLLLLFTGIHNAWDTVIYMAVDRRNEERHAAEKGGSVAPLPAGVPSVAAPAREKQESAAS